MHGTRVRVSQNCSFHTAFAHFAVNVLGTWAPFDVNADALQNSAAVLTLAGHDVWGSASCSGKGLFRLLKCFTLARGILLATI
jgi:hypothetical protein